MKRAVLLAALLASSTALADATQEARAHFDKAQTHYALGEFEPAIVEFRAAYRLRPEPAILFNIAQAMRQLSQYKSAYFYYSQYLAKKPDAPNRADAENFLAQMKRKADAEEIRLEREGRASADEQLAEEMGLKQAPPAATAPAAPEAARPRKPRYAGYAVLAGGAVAE